MNNSQDLSDRAVVTTNERHARNVVSIGNRTIDPLRAFSQGWTRFLALPPNPVVMVLDAAVWVSGSAVYCLVGHLAPGLLFVPLFAFLVGLATAIWYKPELRALGTVRLILILIGMALTL